MRVNSVYFAQSNYTFALAEKYTILVMKFIIQTIYAETLRRFRVTIAAAEMQYYDIF
jgi:hypothetical protein